MRRTELASSIDTVDESPRKWIVPAAALFAVLVGVRSWVAWKTRDGYAATVAAGLLEAWLDLISVQFVLWVLAAIVLGRWRAVLASRSDADRATFAWRSLLTRPAPYALVLGMFFVLLSGQFLWGENSFRDVLEEHHPLDDSRWFVRTLHLVAAVAAWRGAALLAGLHDRLRALPGELGEDDDHGPAMERYLELQAWTRRVLGLLGGMIGVVLVSTGLLRAVVNAHLAPDGPELSAETVVLYGAFISGVLALAYGPVHVTARRAGLRIVDRLAPRPPTVRSQLDDTLGWSERRESLERMLRLTSSTRQQLETAIPVLAPLLGSLLSIALQS